MNTQRLILLLTMGAFALGACAPAPVPTPCAECAPCPDCPSEEPQAELTPTCDAGTPPADGPTRVRGWVLYNAPDAATSVARLTEAGAFTGGGDAYVIVRADIVTGDPDYNVDLGYNLIVPVDAEDGTAFDEALGILNSAVDDKPVTILHVDSYAPDPPHSAHTFITPGEYWAFPAPEYCPPGRHPQSPGSNPWG